MIKLFKLLIFVAVLMVPGISQAELIPAKGAVAVPLDTELKLVFNEPVRTGDAGTITLVDKNSGEKFAVLDVNSDDIFINENVVSLNIDKPLDRSNYYVLVSGQAIRDIAGNYFKGIESPETWYFSTIEDKPQFNLDGLALNSANGKVKIDWNVQNQNEIVGYELYRTNVTEAGVSGDFELIDSYEINDALKAVEVDFNYTELDADPNLLAGFTYTYKLVSIDKSGMRKVQSVEDVEIMNVSMIAISEISPNPVNEQFSFDITLNSAQNITVEIVNNSGVSVLTPVKNMNYGIGTFTIDVTVDHNSMSSGTYFVKVTNGDNVEMKKFMLTK